MIQGVVLDGKDKRFQHPPAILAYKAHIPSIIKQKERYQSKVVSRKRIPKTDTTEIDDEFGIFDWVTHLDEKDLGDFHLA